MGCDHYSFLKLNAGLVAAILQACDKTMEKLIIVNIEILMNSNPGVMLTLEGKYCNHILLMRYASGTAINTETASKIIKPFDNRTITCKMLEPRTFLTLISFLRVSEV